MNSTPTVMEVAQELLALGLTPVPVVPAQYRGRTKLNGKTPSFFAEDGNPKYLKVNELGLFDRQPTQQEVEEWFGDPRIGIGSFGSPDGKTCWIDFDAKHFESLEECRGSVERWQEVLGIQNTWIDRSGSGGYRILVRFSSPPTFTNFSLAEDGNYHVGELLGKGRFCVLAPSLHPNGNYYERVKSGGAAQIESPEEAYFYPSRKSEDTKVTVAPKNIEVPSLENKWTDSDWARSYLSSISPDKADDYDTWLRIGMALRSVGDPNLLDDWIEFSKQSSKFLPGECERKWGGFKPGKVGLGTLHYFAIEDGWVNPFKGKKSNGNQQTNQGDIAFENWKKYQRFTPDIVVNQKYFEFPKLPENNFIAAVNSGLGTGKTQGLIKETKQQNKGSITPGCRNNLLYQNIEKFKDAGIEKVFHLAGDDAFGFLDDKESHIQLCTNSLPHVSPKHAENKNIYIDETVAVLAHTVNGETLKDEQAYILEIKKQILQKSDGVFLLDGNLRDIDVDLIAKLSGKKPIKIKNEYKGEPHNIKIIDAIDMEKEIKKGDRSPVIKAMMSDGCTPWIVLDSLEQSKKLERLFIEQGKTGINLNSETSDEEWASEYKKNPTEYIQKVKPDYAIGTPTIENGFDVHGLGHFTHKFSIFSGVLTTSAQTQMMFRLRDNLPHWVFCPMVGMNVDRNHPKNFFAAEFQKKISDFILQSADLAAQSSQFSDLVKERLIETIKRSDNLYWDYFCLINSLENYERENLRKCLIYKLREGGHNVEEVELPQDDFWGYKEKEAKEAVQAQLAKEILEAPSIEIEEARKLTKKGASTKDEQRSIERAFLLNRIPGFDKSSLWNEDFILKYHIKDKHYLSKQERFWFLQNTQIAARKHLIDWYFRSENEYFFCGMARRSNYSSIWALGKLGITKFLEPNATWHKESKEVIKLFEQGQSPEIILALGVSPGKASQKGKERIEYLKVLLDLTGVKLAKPQQQTIGGQRLRVYGVDIEALKCPVRLEVLTKIGNKFSQWFKSDKAEIAWKDGMVETAARTPQLLYTGGGFVQQSPETPEPAQGQDSGDFEVLHAGGGSSELDEAIDILAACDTTAESIPLEGSAAEIAIAPKEDAPLEPEYPKEVYTVPNGEQVVLVEEFDRTTKNGDVMAMAKVKYLSDGSSAETRKDWLIPIAS